MPDIQMVIMKPKHKRLLRFSKFATIFAWGHLVIYVIDAVVKTMNSFVYYSNIPSSIDLFMESPVIILRVYWNSILTLLYGGLGWIVLKGIALGLNMVVETDLNYRSKD
jgi:hypothetical protein